MAAQTPVFHVFLLYFLVLLSCTEPDGGGYQEYPKKSKITLTELRLAVCLSLETWQQISLSWRALALNSLTCTELQALIVYSHTTLYASHLILEVKQGWAWLVLGWETESKFGDLKKKKKKRRGQGGKEVVESNG